MEIGLSYAHVFITAERTVKDPEDPDPDEVEASLDDNGDAGAQDAADAADEKQGAPLPPARTTSKRTPFPFSRAQNRPCRRRKTWTRRLQPLSAAPHFSSKSQLLQLARSQPLQQAQPTIASVSRSQISPLRSASQSSSRISVSWSRCCKACKPASRIEL